MAASFVAHYNDVRLHSALGYVTPADKLAGLQGVIFAERDRKLEAARALRRQHHTTERPRAQCREHAPTNAYAKEHRERLAGPGAAMSPWSPENLTIIT